MSNTASNAVYTALDQSFVAVGYTSNRDKLSNVKAQLGSLYEQKFHLDDLFDRALRAKAIPLSREERIDTRTLQEIEEAKQKRHTKNAKKKLSSRDRKKLKLNQLPMTGYHYDDFTPMTQLWKQYIKDLIGRNLTQANIENHIVKADYHFSFMSVVKSVNPSLIGKSGIVIKETQHLFCILQPNNRLVKIQKQGSIFQLDLSFLGNDDVDQSSSSTTITDVNNDQSTADPSTMAPNNTHPLSLLPDTTGQFGPFPSSEKLSVLIYGDQMLIRPYERSKRKFKVSSTIELGK